MARKLKNPKGTRDFYPLDMLRRRYITEAWRAVSLRHAFEEIDGPTFEHLDLYTIKSGDEIVSQLFSFTRAGGTDTYALRPEFTPTLARMYAAQAATLPKPVRWFSILPYFRAERPQRGRLREFLQWNCDVIGDSSPQAEAEMGCCVVESMRQLGLSPDTARLKASDRTVVSKLLSLAGVAEDDHVAALALLDRRDKLPADAFQAAAQSLDLDVAAFDTTAQMARHGFESGSNVSTVRRKRMSAPVDPRKLPMPSEERPEVDITMDDLRRAANLDQEQVRSSSEQTFSLSIFRSFVDGLILRGSDEYFEPDFSVVRGLAYYTGTVFEVIAEGERAVAGGGRYDNLIKLLGGPDTPAVGFAMGDVVLANLLEDNGLMPTDDELPAAVEAMTRSQSVRPEVFVVAGAEEDDHRVTPLVANLRRGIERNDTDAKPWNTAERYDVPPLHARTTDKTTHNLKKLLADAERQRARFAAVIHGDDKVQLKDLDARDDLGDFSVHPDSPDYLGRAVADRLGRAPARA